MRIRTRIKNIKRDTLVFYPLLGSLLCILLGAILIPSMKSSMPELIPLFYSLPRTAERLGSQNSLFLLPLSSMIITIVNFLCIFLFSSEDKVMSRMLSFSSLLVGILSLYTLLRIIFLII